MRPESLGCSPQIVGHFNPPSPQRCFSRSPLRPISSARRLRLPRFRSTLTCSAAPRSSPATPIDLARGDLDGDGVPDVVVVDGQITRSPSSAQRRARSFPRSTTRPARARTPAWHFDRREAGRRVVGRTACRGRAGPAPSPCCSATATARSRPRSPTRRTRTPSPSRSAISTRTECRIWPSSTRSRSSAPARAPSDPPRERRRDVQTATEFPAGDGPGAIVAGDFDGDYHLDLAITNFIPVNVVSAVAVLTGDGHWSFASPNRFRPVTSREAVAADLDGDGVSYRDLRPRRNAVSGWRTMGPARSSRTDSPRVRTEGDRGRGPRPGRKPTSR